MGRDSRVSSSDGKGRLVLILAQNRRQRIFHEIDQHGIKRQDSGKETQEATQGCQGCRTSGKGTDLESQADHGIGDLAQYRSIARQASLCECHKRRAEMIVRRREVQLGQEVHAGTVVQYLTRRSGVSPWVGHRRGVFRSNIALLKKRDGRKARYQDCEM
jgi:hypothetical protein